MLRRGCLFLLAVAISTAPALGQELPDFTVALECSEFPCTVGTGENATYYYSCGACDESCYKKSSCGRDAQCGTYNSTSETVDLGGGNSITYQATVPADGSAAAVDCSGWVCLQTPQLWIDIAKAADSKLEIPSTIAVCMARDANAATIAAASPLLLTASALLATALLTLGML